MDIPEHCTILGFTIPLCSEFDWGLTSVVLSLCCTRISKEYEIAHFCYQTQGQHIP